MQIWQTFPGQNDNEQKRQWINFPVTDRKCPLDREPTTPLQKYSGFCYRSQIHSQLETCCLVSDLFPGCKATGECAQHIILKTKSSNWLKFMLVDITWSWSGKKALFCEISLSISDLLTRLFTVQWVPFLSLFQPKHPTPQSYLRTLFNWRIFMFFIYLCKT